jgi:hypothetical protein
MRDAASAIQSACALTLAHWARARSIAAWGLSRKYTSDVPLEKQYILPSSGSIQLSEQSALIRAPAATPIGSRLSNSPCIGRGGTAAFQIPPPRTRAAGAV